MGQYHHCYNCCFEGWHMMISVCRRWKAASLKLALRRESSSLETLKSITTRWEICCVFFPFKHKTVLVCRFINDAVNVVCVHIGRRVSVERYMVKMYAWELLVTDWRVRVSSLRVCQVLFTSRVWEKDFATFKCQRLLGNNYCWRCFLTTVWWRQ